MPPTKTTINGRSVDTEIIARRPALAVKIGEAVHVVTDVRRPSPSEIEFILNGSVVRGWCFAGPDELYVRIAGNTHIVNIARPGASGAGNAQTVNDIRAEMPGTVVALHIAEGDPVALGQKLMTVESMKLQIGVVAPRDGVVAKVHAQLNSTFDRGAALVSLAPAVGENASAKGNG